MNSSHWLWGRSSSKRKRARLESINSLRSSLLSWSLSWSFSSSAGFRLGSLGSKIFIFLSSANDSFPSWSSSQNLSACLVHLIKPCQNSADQKLSFWAMDTKWFFKNAFSFKCNVYSRHFNLFLPLWTKIIILVFGVLWLINIYHQAVGESLANML